jgi:HPt (histidine-containing phosphotransfer) domain-containing protein
VTGRLDEGRLRAQAASPRPVLYAGIARGWIAALPAAAAGIRAADPGTLPRALHELRSGAVAVGLPALAGALAALEQRAERGDPPAPAEVETVLDLAARSADDLAGWWAQAGAAPGG